MRLGATPGSVAQRSGAAFTPVDQKMTEPSVFTSWSGVVSAVGIVPWASTSATGIELRSTARLGDGEPGSIEAPGDREGPTAEEMGAEGPPVGWIMAQPATMAAHATIVAGRRPLMLSGRPGEPES